MSRMLNPLFSRTDQSRDRLPFMTRSGVKGEGAGGVLDVVAASRKKSRHGVEIANEGWRSAVLRTTRSLTA